MAQAEIIATENVGVTDIVLMADPRVAAIPVVDSGEPLRDVSEGTSRRVHVDTRLADDTGAWRRARGGVVDRLHRAADHLPPGMGILLIEAYRPPALQTFYFERYRDELARLDPDRGGDELRMLTSRYISPPEIAPHSAGSAVDLTLCTDTGAELDLGTAYDATPEASDEACYTAAQNITDDARVLRDLLSTAMSDAGFVNYPTEWWHWSYGDRYWALSTGSSTALYGPTT